MYPAGPDDGHRDQLSRRLAEQLAALDDESSAHRDQGAALVTALIEQLAAGQSETLYGLHAAAAQLRRRASELEEAARQIPHDLAPHLEELLAGLTEQALIGAAAEVDGLQQSLSTETRRSTDELVAAFRSATFELSREGQHVAQGVREAVGQLEDASAELRAIAAAAVGAIESAARAATADTTAAAQAMTAAGENILDRLIGMLDERDRRDQLLEDRLTARVERLTKKTEATVTRLIGELADETDLLRQRDEADRASAAQQLQSLLDQLLSQPRGKLKGFRSDIARTQEEDGS